MRSLQIARFVTSLMFLACVPACSPTPVNKQEAADWYASHASMVRWVGYRGSDQQFHHYIARVMDDWTYIQIPKDEMTVADERPYSAASGAPLYYYLVDP